MRGERLNGASPPREKKELREHRDRIEVRRDHPDLEGCLQHLRTLLPLGRITYGHVLKLDTVSTIS